MLFVQYCGCLAVVWEVELVCMMVKVLVSYCPCIQDIFPDDFLDHDHNLFAIEGQLGVDVVNGLSPVNRKSTMIHLVLSKASL